MANETSAGYVPFSYPRLVPPSKHPQFVDDHFDEESKLPVPNMKSPDFSVETPRTEDLFTQIVTFFMNMGISVFREELS